jgi:large subunit ribosomal protein L23
MIDPYKIILRPVVTEKCTRLSQAKRGKTEQPLNQYTFEVARSATKPQIREAIEVWWKAERGVPIKVAAVNTMNVDGKWKKTLGKQHYGRTPDWKKAIVTLKAGSSMDIY